MWLVFALTTFLAVNARAEIENHEWDLAVAIEGQIELLTSNGTLIGTTVEFTKLKALTFDNIRHQFVVSDMNGHDDTIYMVSLTQEETKNANHNAIIQNLPDDIQGLAIDPLNDTLYWSNPRNKTINYISLTDPNNVGVFMSFDDESPQDLAIDSCRRYIYWTNSNLDKPTIDRAKLDGSEHEILIDTDLYMPVGIAIDYVKKRLYWSDMGEGIYFKIESSDLEGKDRAATLEETHQRPYGLAVDEESIYWTDVNNNALWKIRKDEEHPNKVRGFKEKPLGLIAKHLGFIDAPECAKIEQAIEEHDQTEVIKLVNEIEEETLLQTVCLNNGELTENNSCSCPKGFKGRNCEVSLCHNYCVHGTCSMTLPEYPICKCNPGYTGNRCEYDLCHNYCLNGGKCTHKGSEPKCRCPEGYIGEQCQININFLAMCTVYCNNRKAADFNENITCNCEMQKERLSEEYIDDKSDRIHLTISDYMRDPAFLVLCICMVIICAIVIALAVLFQKMKKRRPRINKRIIVNKNVTPLTNRPSIDQCEITIENCCNMNVCETPCFEPPQLRKAKKASDEKKNLLKNMETGDDLY